VQREEARSGGDAEERRRQAQVMRGRGSVAMSGVFDDDEMTRADAD